MSDLSGVRIKIDRAKHHLDCLERAISEYTASDPYIIVVDEKAKPGEKLCRFKFVTPIPIALADMIGDTIHNLRSALDMLAVAMVVHEGHTTDEAMRRTQFPIAASEQTFKKYAVPKHLEFASASARQIITDLKPYKGAADAFYQINELDLIDKHRALIPVGINRGQVGIELKNVLVHFTEEHRQTVNLAEIPLGSFRTNRPLQDGDVVFSLPVQIIPDLVAKSAAGVMRIKVEMPPPQDSDFKFTFEIAFGKDQVVDGEPVIPTLKQFIDFTEGAISTIERKFF